MKKIVSFRNKSIFELICHVHVCSTNTMPKPPTPTMDAYCILSVLVLTDLDKMVATAEGMKRSQLHGISGI